MPAISLFVYSDLCFFHKNNLYQFCKIDDPPVTNLWKTITLVLASLRGCMLVCQKVKKSPTNQPFSYTPLVFALAHQGLLSTQTSRLEWHDGRRESDSQAGGWSDDCLT